MILIKFFKEMDCFKKDHGKLLQSDWKELVSALKYKEVEPGTEIYSMFDKVTDFYVILSGAVNIKKKNPNIKDWDWAMKMNKGLLKWKQQCLDKRIKPIM